MKNLFPIFLFQLFTVSFSCSEDTCIKWNELKSLKICVWPRNINVDALPWSKIDSLKSVELDINKVKPILESSECRNREVTVWKDYYLGIVSLNNGKRIRIMISDYGGFMYDLSKKFYFVSSANSVDWNNLIHDASLRLNEKRN